MPVVAIDQGTTSTRALLVDESGEGGIIKATTHRQFYPEPGWVEHDSEELLAHIRLCIAECLDACATVSAIGFANQGESCLAWDADSKEAITPVIVWQDNRSRKTIEKLRAQGAQDIVLQKAGVPLDSYFSASKLGWIFARIPAAKALHRRGKLRLGTTDAFFLERLTGRFVTDITTASRTSLLNLESGQWDSELCDLFWRADGRIAAHSPVNRRFRRAQIKRKIDSGNRQRRRSTSLVIRTRLPHARRRQNNLWHRGFCVDACRR